jgi:hypothetical protein
MIGDKAYSKNDQYNKGIPGCGGIFTRIRKL